MRTLIIIPAYNEDQAIVNVLDDIRVHYPGADVVVINDGSGDATSAVAKATGAKVIDLPYNLGIGGAMQTGYKYAAGKDYDIAVQFDGDGQHRADQIGALLKPIVEGNADIVIGSRFLGPEGYALRISRLVGIKIIAWTVSLLCRRRVTDPTSGFRAARRNVMSLYTRHYPEDYPEPEAIVLLHRAGFRMAEVPVLMRERETGSSSITAARAFYYMIKVLLAIMIDMIKVPGR
jgi:glycosyltransferase involved in cell wall biosynthesis